MAERGQTREQGRTAERRRHCMVVYAYYPHSETRVQRQAEALVEAGYAVDVVCLRAAGEAPRERYRGVDVHRLPVQVVKRSLARQFVAYLRFFVLAAVHLSRLHIRHRYGTVQVHNLPDFLVFSALLPKLQGTPVILDLHDLMPEFFAGRFGSKRRRALASLIGLQERAACRFADHVITVSDHWRSSLIERGVPDDKVSVVMNVADERIFARSEAARTVDGTFRLIYHGTVTERYGLDLALRAVHLLRDEIPGIRLTILGQGDQMPALFRLRDELALDDVVELRDEIVPSEELPEIVAASDLGVVPYRNDVFTDGLLPTKLMEYAVMEIPCVAARTTAIATTFGDAGTVFFDPCDATDLADRIRELHGDRERLHRLATRWSTFTTRYSWVRIGADYVRLIERLGGESRNRP